MNIFGRRTFSILVSFVIAGTVAGLVAALFFIPSPINITPYHILLTWSDSPQTTQTIAWQTGQLLANGRIQYAKAEEAATFTAKAVSVSANGELLAAPLGDVTAYSATLTGLNPATQYVYRVGNGMIWSDPHTFTTAPADDQDFTFLLFGDSQGARYEQWKATVQKAYQENRDAAFMISAGDLVDSGLDYGQWSDWFAAGRDVIDSLSVMPVMGNHETYTADWKIVPPALFTTLFQLPANGPAELRGKVYSFDYGNAHFSVLDSQMEEEQEFIPNMLALQKAWLEKDLQSSAKKWKLVFIHRPLYHNRPTEGDAQLREAFAPIVDAYGVDAVFSGHDHVYARSYPIRAGVWAKDNPGTVYITTGRSGMRVFSRAIAKEWDAAFLNPTEQPIYLTVKVTGQYITVQAFKQNGDKIDEWRSEK